jgi:hypothetical protein
VWKELRHRESSASMLRGFLSSHQLDQECDLGTDTIGHHILCNELTTQHVIFSFFSICFRWCCEETTFHHASDVREAGDAFQGAEA